MPQWGVSKKYEFMHYHSKQYNIIIYGKWWEIYSQLIWTICYDNADCSAHGLDMFKGIIAGFNTSEFDITQETKFKADQW